MELSQKYIKILKNWGNKPSWCPELYSDSKVRMAHSIYITPPHVVAIHIWVFVPPRHEHLCPDVEEIGVKYLWPWSDSLLDVGVCCISLASQTHHKDYKDIQTTGTHTTRWTCVSSPRCGWEITDLLISAALKFFLVFPSLYRKISGQFMKPINDRFVPNFTN
jgi:hypothetical protein